jgi:hypothetical protein
MRGYCSNAVPSYYIISALGESSQDLPGSLEVRKLRQDLHGAAEMLPTQFPLRYQVRSLENTRVNPYGETLIVETYGGQALHKPCQRPSYPLGNARLRNLYNKSSTGRAIPF